MTTRNEFGKTFEKREYNYEDGTSIVEYFRTDRDVYVSVDSAVSFVSLHVGYDLPFGDEGQWWCPMASLTTAFEIAANDAAIDDIEVMDAIINTTTTIYAVAEDGGVLSAYTGTVAARQMWADAHTTILGWPVQWVEEEELPYYAQ